jgi:diguanylate cyclase (GGDEF)-like protein/PAS domain S-box-containing protein
MVQQRIQQFDTAQVGRRCVAKPSSAPSQDAEMNEQVSSLLAAMEILPDGLLVVDNRQQIVGCNHEAENIFGYEPGELTGKPLSTLLPSSIRSTHSEYIADFDSSGGIRPMSKRPILCGLSKVGARLPLSIGISTTGSGRERLFVAIVRDACSLDDTLEDARILAETDPLTGLGNRRYLMSWFEEQEENASGSNIGLLFLDLDRFKPLNDEHGHEVGDEVLHVVGLRLRRALRDSDLCVRLGGDEFAIVISGISKPDDLERIALKLHASLTAPISVCDITVSVGVSIGGTIAIFSPSQSDELLKRADTAMYQAKTQSLPYCYANVECADAA